MELELELEAAALEELELEAAALDELELEEPPPNLAQMALATDSVFKASVWLQLLRTQGVTLAVMAALFEALHWQE